jgi:Restriction Endonuclease associating with ARP
MFRVGEARVKVVTGRKSQTVNIDLAGSVDADHAWIVRMQWPNLVSEAALAAMEFATVDDLVTFLQQHHDGLVERGPGREAQRHAAVRGGLPSETAAAGGRRAQGLRDLSARVLEQLACAGPADWVPAARPSQMAFGGAVNRDRLAVVLLTRKKKDADRAMSWGLSWVGDRELVLAFPRAPVGDPAILADGARSRAWALSCQVRIALYDDTGQVETVPAFTRAQRDARLTEKAMPGSTPQERLRMNPPRIHDAADVIAIIDQWARSCGAVRADRRSYCAWQMDGRLVVQLAPGEHGHGVLAVGPGRLKATPAASGTIKSLSAQWEELRDRADAVVARRLSGHDDDDRESRVQARLSRLWGLNSDHREVPARRPYRGDGKIDLIRVCDSGVLELVETKVGFDDCLLLQGLDYLAWAQANAESLAQFYGLATPPRLRLRLVVADPTTSKERLARWANHRQHINFGLDVSWEKVADWDGLGESAPRLEPLPLGAPSRPTWRSRQVARLRSLPPARSAETVVAEARWALTPDFPYHRHFSVPWSSQAFAVNLFAPLTQSDVAALMVPTFGPLAQADRPVFEWTDDEDRLHESTAPRPHRTQVDVVLRARGADGRRFAILVEVKYSEPDFSGCSACDAAPIDAIGPCVSPGPFGGDPTRCYQLRNRDKGDRRAYDQVLPDLAAAPDWAGCLFRSGLNQVMRLVALARALQVGGELDDWRVALCAPQGNRSVHRTWALALSVFGDRLVTINPSAVLARHPPAIRAFLADRYLEEQLSQ